MTSKTHTETHTDTGTNIEAATTPTPSTTSHRPVQPARRPARLPIPLRAELRRGMAPWLGVAVAVTLVVPMLSKAAQWQGSWGETQGQLHSASALLAGPLAAAAGCWQGGRERRRGTIELRGTTVRTPLAQSLLCLAPLVLWILAGYVAAAAAVFLATWPYSPVGSPLVSFAATDATWIGTAATLGFVAGRLIPWRLAAPVVAAFMYVTVGFPSYVDSNIQYLSPASSTDADTYLPVWWHGPVMIVWLGGPGFAALLAYAARRRSTALLPLAGALAAAGLITHTGSGIWQKAPAVTRAMCSTTVPRICVSGLDGVRLPDVSRALAGVVSRLEGVDGAPVAYLDQHQNPKAAEGEATLPYVTRGWGVVRNRLTDPDDYAHQTVMSMLWRTCDGKAYAKDKAGAERVDLTDEAVRNWLAPLGHSPDRPAANFGPNSAPDATARLAAMGEEQRRQWLGRYLATHKSCTPSEVPVL
ncbi:hypothetical protein [Streptomyces sp. NPDC055287]